MLVVDHCVRAITNMKTYRAMRSRPRFTDIVGDAQIHGNEDDDVVGIPRGNRVRLRGDSTT